MLHMLPSHHNDACAADTGKTAAAAGTRRYRHRASSRRVLTTIVLTLCDSSVYVLCEGRKTDALCAGNDSRKAEQAQRVQSVICV